MNSYQVIAQVMSQSACNHRCFADSHEQMTCFARGRVRRVKGAFIFLMRACTYVLIFSYIHTLYISYQIVKSMTWKMSCHELMSCEVGHA